jgi:multiple sugar transport system permease protein
MRLFQLRKYRYFNTTASLGKFVKSDNFFWIALFLPTLIVLLLVFIYPLTYSFYLSLTNYSIINPIKFVYFRNYINILRDPNVWNSIIVTFQFSLGALFCELLLGFGIALVLNSIQVGKNAFRTITTMPIMLTPVVIGVVWRMMTNYDFGIFNYFLVSLGFDRINWVSNIKTALPLLILSDVWQETGFVILVLSAGLAQIPKELIEASEIDGANFWQRLIYIIVPTLRPNIIVVLVFRSMSLLRMFDKAFTLTHGGPSRSTETITFHIYNRMFQGYQIGYSAAAAYILLIVTLIVLVPLIRKM